MYYLITYDISNPRRLRRVARHLQRYGIRQEKSVFLCEVTENQLERLKFELRLLSDKEDSIMVFPTNPPQECLAIRGEFTAPENNDIFY